MKLSGSFSTQLIGKKVEELRAETSFSIKKMSAPSNNNEKNEEEKDEDEEDLDEFEENDEVDESIGDMECFVMILADNSTVNDEDD